MITVHYKPSFLRKFRWLPTALQEEVKEKVESFKNPDNHSSLRVHKFSGPLAGRMSFSVNYKWRIIFRYVGSKKQEAVFLTTGDHSVYE